MKTPSLPNPNLARRNVRAWTAVNPHLASLLRAGVPAVEALSRWGQRLLAEQRSIEASEALRSALALAPDDALLWTNFGIALDQSGSPGEAALCLERSLTLARQQPDAWLLLGVVKTKLADLPAAEAAYRVALELSPGSAVAHQLLGLLKQQQRDHAGAIACFVACVEAGGGTAGIWANLGKLYYQEGLIMEAHEAYDEASTLDTVNPIFQQMARKTQFLQQALHGESLDDALYRFQASFSPAERYSEKELQALLSSSFSFLSGFGHIEAAKCVGKKLLELWPASPSLRYLLQAVTGDSALDRSAPEYVIAHFDEFAPGFDAQLVGALGYDIPEKLCAAVRDLVLRGPLLDTLDAGCGTGLCGPLLRPLSRTLTGVDLSSKMLEQAAKRGVYDALECEDLTVFLRHDRAPFDLIVAADVLIYFGDLGSVFAAAASALESGGLFACSTEWQAGEGYLLQPSGRFAHAPGYVLATASAAFEAVTSVETTIRLEARQRLLGNLFVFRRH